MAIDRLARTSVKAATSPRDVARPQLADAGLFLLMVATPLAVTPFSASPFGDAKLVLLVGGTLAMWASGPPIDRRIGWIGLAWLAATFVAAIAGVDPWAGLTAQANSSGGGVILVTCIAALAAVGAGLPEATRERARSMLVGGGLAVAAIAIAFRIAPDAFESLFPNRSLGGSTLGNPVFGAAFCAAALAAVLGDQRPRARRRLVRIAILAFACATFDQRSALLLPLIALVGTLLKAHQTKRRVIEASVSVLGAILIYLLLSPVLPPIGVSSLDQMGDGSDTARTTAWVASFRGWTERPVLGWGPGSTHTAYIRGATPEQLDVAGRGFGDAHNIFVETLASGGLVSLAALLALTVVLLSRAFRARQERAWAFGGLCVLGVLSLGEPLNMVTTPLLFLLAAIAAGPGRTTEASVLARRARLGVLAGLTVSLLVTVLLLTAATFEHWGAKYGEVWALETSIRLQPWRLSAERELAFRLASDAAGGQPGSAAATRAVIEDAVTGHPWDPTVRLWAAQVEHLMRDDVRARTWLDRQVALFPADGPMVDTVRLGPTTFSPLGSPGSGL